MKLKSKKDPLPGSLLRELAELTTDSGRTKFISVHPRLLKDEVVQQLNEVVRAKLRENAREALSLAETSVAIARRLRIKRLWGAACARRPTPCTCSERISWLSTTTMRLCEFSRNR